MDDNTTCSHNCEDCSSNCDSREKIKKEKQNAHSNVKKVIGIVSGKGGVGKSLVASLLAVTMKRRGFSVAVLDADVTGPSIPKIFGVRGEVIGSEYGILPMITKTGIEIMSVNLLLEDETRPVVWRGPVIAGTVKQFWSDVVWEDVDFMFVDMPPGTGDVPLTVFQSLPVDGIIIVGTPQELVSMIVSKAANMASMMGIKVLGIIENMSYIKCPDCGAEIHVFGESKLDEFAASLGYEVLGRIPLDPKLSSLCDRGDIELAEGGYLDFAASEIEKTAK